MWSGGMAYRVQTGIASVKWSDVHTTQITKDDRTAQAYVNFILAI